MAGVRVPGPAARIDPTRAVAAPPTARTTRRRRRPSGAPPPLPRHLGASGKFWLALTGFGLAFSIVTLHTDVLLGPTSRADVRLLQAIARHRTPWLDRVAGWVNDVVAAEGTRVVAAGTILALLVFRRWRHLFTLVGSIALLEMAGGFLLEHLERPRPHGVRIIGDWGGFAMPSPPVAVLATALVAVAYSLVVPGRPRTIAKWVVGAVLVTLAAARLYLAVDHPSDVVLALVFGVTIPVIGFRVFTPNDVFPVAYRRGKTAHLDVTGARGEAIRRAIADQLGLTVLEAKPVGLEGSGGSTPLRLRVAGDPDTWLFAKLYAKNHLRADRWYKWGRTILYGRLEDEPTFQSVRRLAEYEDYALRLLRDLGIPTAEPYGIVEMTPEREYLIVTSFFDGAKEIGEADVDDDVIDQGLAIVRALWDAGLAHRDIKPANLMVHEGHVKLIDVFFVQVRPSPWRQAVDLANMMLVLAVRTDAERVYRRALRHFTPDEIAEAFAATRGLASPTQLRAAMKRDGRDLLGQFRALAPHRRPVAIQRWSVRRVALAIVALAVLLLSVSAVSGLVRPAHDLEIAARPECGTGNVMVLVAQAVPTATVVPCVAGLPSGWRFDRAKVHDGEARFWLDSDQAGHRAVEVTLRPPGGCDVTGAQRVPSDEAGTERYEQPERLPPGYRGTRTYLFEGGCAIYRYRFAAAAPIDLVFDVDLALAFEPRGGLVDAVRDDTGLRLCGAGTPTCPG